MGHRILRFTANWMFFWFILSLTGCSGMYLPGKEGKFSVKGSDTWPRPTHFQPQERQPDPGLSVVYLSKKVRHIDDMPGSKWMARNGRPGKPIQVIGHQFGNGDVFDSGKNQGICVQMQGYLNFNETGVYRIKANSNDGIRVFLDNKMILNDPDVHADRFTPDAEIEIKQPGHYAVLVRYFQRKGKATLEMFWKTPESQTYNIIPAMAYSHAGSQS